MLSSLYRRPGSFRLVALGAVLAAPATAQQRSLNFTGHPVAALAEPFTQIVGIRELPGNRIVVADRSENRLVLGNLATGQVSDIGRKGDGPGEYRLAGELFPGQSGETWMTSAGKVFVISPEGKIANIFPQWGNEAGFTPQTSIGVDRLGHLFFLRGRFGADSAPVLRWLTGAKVVDTVVWIANPKFQVGMVQPNGRLQFDRNSSHPFDAEDIWVPLPDGRLAGVRAQPFRIDFISGHDVLHGPTIPYAPISVTAKDRDEYRTVQAKQKVHQAGSGSPDGSPRPAPFIADADFAKTKPPFVGHNSVQVSPDGQIWILRTRRAEDATPIYDIFDGKGTIVGHAILKPHTTVIGFGVNSVYGARQDPDTDLWYIEKYAR